MLFDPFKDGYSLKQLTQAINALPNQYSRTTQMGLFTWRPGTHNVISVEMREGVLSLVPTTPWGGVAPKSKPGKRNVRSFQVPHMPFEDVVLASEVMGVRAFGTDNQAETVNGVVNDKLQVMKDKIDMTLEWRRFNALKGYVLDADGSIIEDYFAAFGVTKKVISLGLSNANTDVRAKCMQVLRWVEDNAQGALVTGVRAMVSPELFDALTGHAKVQAVYQGWAEAANKLGGDLRKGFVFGGLTFEEYRASVDGQRFIDEGKGHAFPLGATDLFSDFGAPADFNETVNTVALPYYARQQNKDFNRGIDLHTQANILPLVNRPSLLVELTV